MFEIRISKTPVSNARKNTINIYPSNEKWNDFGHRTMGNAIINIEENIIEFSILFAMTNLKGEYVGINDFEFESNEINVKEHKFFSIISDINGYRRLIKKTRSTEVALSILTTMNDIAALQGLNKKEEILEINKSDAFKLSFMRDYSARFAFYHAFDIIKGLENEKLDYITSSFCLNLKLEQYENSPVLHINTEKDNILPGRIAVLIGENGVGKTQSLRSIIECFYRNKDDEIKLVDCDTDSEPRVNKIIAIEPPGEVTGSLPRKNDVNYKVISTLEENKNIFNNLIKLGSSEKTIASQDIWDIFIDSISEVIDPRTIWVCHRNKENKIDSPLPIHTLHRASANDKKKLEYEGKLREDAHLLIKTKSNMVHMSSGQLAFFNLALAICLHIDNGTLFIIDEPETHLHPSFIALFTNMINNLLTNTGSIAIIATHSPYFVREVNRDQVSIFTKENGRLLIQNPRLKTFGANIGDISFFIFDQDYGNTLKKTVLEQAKKNSMTYSKIKENYANKLPSEVLYYLKENLEK